MNQVLLTVSGVIDPGVGEQVARGERPEPDYLRMARVFKADLIDYQAARQAGGWLGRLLARVGGANLMLAWACFCLRHKYKVIFSDGEQVGLPLAFLLKLAGSGKRPKHLMIAHVLSAGKKLALLEPFRLHSHIDKFFVYSTWQKKLIEARCRLPEGRVIFTPFMVDADFFSRERAIPGDPLGLEANGQPVICAVGLELRDYPTLLKAVRGLDAQVVIAAASPWSKRADSTAGQQIPTNVILRRFSQHELRDVYAASRCLVMPLYPNNFQAGVTAILEAMAMELPVICTHTLGQTDVVLEGQTGIYVPPFDPQTLRKAIEYMLNHPDQAARMGQDGRFRIMNNMSLDCYAERLKRYL